MDDQVVRQVPQGFATGIYLFIWNLSGIALCNVIIQGLAVFLLLKPLLEEIEACTRRYNDDSSKKEVYNASVGPVDNGPPPNELNFRGWQELGGPHRTWPTCCLLSTR